MSLPNEILLLIISHVSHHHLPSLRQVSHSIRALVDALPEAHLILSHYKPIRIRNSIEISPAHVIIRPVLFPSYIPRHLVENKLMRKEEMRIHTCISRMSFHYQVTTQRYKAFLYSTALGSFYEIEQLEVRDEGLFKEGLGEMRIVLGSGGRKEIWLMITGEEKVEVTVGGFCRAICRELEGRDMVARRVHIWQMSWQEVDGAFWLLLE